MASIDPFLHDWDERFHALVAKNMIANPFIPMLRVMPVLPYEAENWCCNHIWLHKQPLFLWQMALSIKIFGVNEFSLRLPSVIMGVVSIYFIYDIAIKWIKNINVAYLAALLFTVSYYHLELSSGRFPLGQNDVAFSFYVTGSIWAFLRYIKSEKSYFWAIVIGFFVGCAVLNKWLTGILIFGGWGLYECINMTKKMSLEPWKHFLTSILTSVLIFMPWQLYIQYNFPLESSIMYAHNRNHIFEVIEGQQGSIWFHFEQMGTAYGEGLLIFIPIGLLFLFKVKHIDRTLSLALISMVIVIYAFFSLLVKTKMPAFTYPVNAVVWIFIACGLFYSFDLLKTKIPLFLFAILMIIIPLYTFKPWQMANYRSKDNDVRMAKIKNTQVYKTLTINDDLKTRIILNCKTFEDVELMFYKNVNAYSWYPDESTLNNLKGKGHTFAAFNNHNNQFLPDYITDDSEIIIIDKQIH